MIEIALDITPEIGEIRSTSEYAFYESASFGVYLRRGRKDILISYIDADQYPKEQRKEKSISQNISYELPFDGSHGLFDIR